MKNIQVTISLPEGDFNTEVLEFEEKDRKFLLKIYNEWRNLCTSLNSVSARGVNLPEGLSESAFCLEMGCVRTTQGIKTKKGQKVNTSFDAYNLKTKKRIQIKACSVLPDLTSFGPKSTWDEIYLVDFYANGKWDGTFNIYYIDNEDIYSHKVNADQTFREQQAEKRRPRFSIFDGIIQAKDIKPIKVGNLNV